MKLDQQTLKDLELFQTFSEGVPLFQLLDRTKTRDGQRRFHERLENPPHDPSEIKGEQEIVRFFLEAPVHDFFRVSQQDLDRFERYLDSNFLTFRFEQSLLGSLQCRFLEFSNPTFANFAKTGVGDVFHLLLEACSVFSLIGSWPSPPPKIRGFLDHFRALRDFLGNSVLEGEPTPRSFPFPELVRLDHLFRKELKSNLRILGENLVQLDCYVSMAKATCELGLHLPEILDGEKTSIRITGVRHLFLERPRANSFRAEEGSHLFFLTGPNMAGKTTFLKSCAIAIVMAQAGMGVPAENMSLTPFSQVFCSLSSIDDIRNGVSSFCAEVRRVKHVSGHFRPGERVFAVFDELFKGTNVKDAVDCSKEVVEGFSRFPRHVVLISSHLLELASLVDGTKGISFWFFNADLGKNKLEFDYVLRPGVNEKRFGFLILVEEGVRELLARPLAGTPDPDVTS